MSGQGSPPGPRRSRGTSRQNAQDTSKPDTKPEDSNPDAPTSGPPIGGRAPSGGAPPGGAGGAGRGAPAAGKPTGFFFNTWLDRGLHELYDVVASEPIPEALLKLLDEAATPARDGIAKDGLGQGGLGQDATTDVAEEGTVDGASAADGSSNNAGRDRGHGA